jgi:hypothetical protein
MRSGQPCDEWHAVAGAADIGVSTSMNERFHAFFADIGSVAKRRNQFALGAIIKSYPSGLSPSEILWSGGGTNIPIDMRETS